MHDMSMSQLQSALAKLGHPGVRAPRVRDLEASGHIPRAGRDFKNARVFTNEHVEALVRRLESRKKQKAESHST